MSSGDPTLRAFESTAAVPLSTDFCAEDADVVIRAAGSIDFRVHKAILSLVSPIFKDMFNLPQPPSDTPGSLPLVDVHDPAKTWETILRTIYPTLPNPTIDTLDDLESLLLAAQVYEMQSVIEPHKKSFQHQSFIEEDPLRLYTIACVCGLEDQATYVARNAELVTVTSGRSKPSDMKGLTFSAYCELVSFLASRDNKLNQTLGRPGVGISWCSCYSQSGSVDSFYSDIKQHLRRPYLQTEELYLKALEDLSRHAQSGCGRDACAFKISNIKAFIRGRIEERERVCDEFQPAKWYCGRMITPVQTLWLISFG